MMNSSRYLSLLCCGLLWCAAGCVLPGEGSRTITIQPEHRYINYELQFEEAYAAPASDGGYDLVMSTGAFAPSVDQGARLYPSTSAPVSHVVMIHVAWRPLSAASGDYPAAANSTVDWYVFDTRNEGACSHYQGLGFVRINLGEHDSLFDLRDVRIKLTAESPSMRDPLGPSLLGGTIRAKNDAPRVRLLTGEVTRRLRMPPATTTPATAPATQP